MKGDIMEMKVVLDNDAKMPTRAHPEDAGLDLYSREDKVIPAKGSASFDTGVHFQLLPHTYGKIESKSGLNVNHNVVCCGGVIDEGYTGSIVVQLYNFGNEDYTVMRGDKIAQLIIQPYMAPVLIQSDHLSNSDRGDNGFGSSGR